MNTKLALALLGGILYIGFFLAAIIIVLHFIVKFW